LKRRTKKAKIEIEIATIEGLGDCLGVMCPDCKETLYIRLLDVKTLMIFHTNKMEGVV